MNVENKVKMSFYYETGDVKQNSPYTLDDLRAMAGDRDIAITDAFVEFGDRTFVSEMVQMDSVDMLDYETDDEWQERTGKDPIGTGVYDQYGEIRRVV